MRVVFYLYYAMLMNCIYYATYMFVLFARIFDINWQYEIFTELNVHS